MKQIMKSLTLTSLLLVVAAGSAFGHEGHDEVRGVKLPEYQTIDLANGMKVLLMERRDVPLIALHARIRGGDVADARGKAGTAELLSELMDKGAGDRSGGEFSEAVEGVGGILSVGSGREAILVNGEFMSRDTSLMIELLSDLLIRPRLDEDEFSKVRSRQIDGIAAAKDSSPGGLMANYFYSSLYGAHPFGAIPDETSLAGISIEDIKTYYRSHLGADRTVLALVGDFDSKKMASQVRSAFDKWRKASAKAPSMAAQKRGPGKRVLLVDKPDATQTWFWIGNVGVARNDADRVLLDVANTAFGGRFTSMLNTELRIKTGLTYGARSVNAQESVPGVIAISSYTKTESTEEAIDRSLAVLDTFREKGLDDETLGSVKAYLAGQFPPDLETGTQLASKLTEIAFYDLGNEEVDDYAAQLAGATRAATKKVIDRVYPGRDDLVVVMLGNAAEIRDVAKKYGKVTEMSIATKSYRAE